MIRGEIWMADLGIPFGSEPGFRRPVVIIQNNAFNKSRIQTVIVASITGNINLAEAPGNIFLESRISGLSKRGVINISQITSIDKRRLIEKVSALPRNIMSELDISLKLVLDLR
ncbi:MAG: type II toxin-antitoxin system PemK/MazF family toxin [Spirochaetales bacterium]|nr:type II toxin-antitoxin system PemK/MazF family toxin [Spirochaetales bacterium]